MEGGTTRLSRRTMNRIIKVLLLLMVVSIGIYQTSLKPTDPLDNSTQSLPALPSSPASESLKNLEIKGRAPKTNYSRAQFGDDWAVVDGCDMRNRILARDLTSVSYLPTMEPIVCKVESGVLNDPYTGKTIQFIRGAETSDDIQIDHVVALSDAWQKGAQQLTPDERIAFANDPLELLAVDGAANQAKSDGDAATWLPQNKSYRCTYVARQIAIKKKYRLWVTRSEYDAMARVLQDCPEQQ